MSSIRELTEDLPEFLESLKNLSTAACSQDEKITTLLESFNDLAELTRVLATVKTAFEDAIVEVAEVPREAGHTDIPLPSGEKLRITFTENITYEKVELEEDGVIVKGSPIPEICATFPNFNDLFRVTYAESGSKLSNLLNTAENLHLVEDSKKGEVYDFLEEVKKYRKTSLSKPKIEVKKK